MASKNIETHINKLVELNKIYQDSKTYTFAKTNFSNQEFFLFNYLLFSFPEAPLILDYTSDPIKYNEDLLVLLAVLAKMFGNTRDIISNILNAFDLDNLAKGVKQDNFLKASNEVLLKLLTSELGYQSLAKDTNDINDLDIDTLIKEIPYIKKSSLLYRNKGTRKAIEIILKSLLEYANDYTITYDIKEFNDRFTNTNDLGKIQVILNKIISEYVDLNTAKNVNIDENIYVSIKPNSTLYNLFMSVKPAGFNYEILMLYISAVFANLSNDRLLLNNNDRQVLDKSYNLLTPLKINRDKIRILKVDANNYKIILDNKKSNISALKYPIKYYYYDNAPYLALNKETDTSQYIGLFLKASPISKEKFDSLTGVIYKVEDYLNDNPYVDNLAIGTRIEDTKNKLYYIVKEKEDKIDIDSTIVVKKAITTTEEEYNNSPIKVELDENHIVNPNNYQVGTVIKKKHIRYVNRKLTSLDPEYPDYDDGWHPTPEVQERVVYYTYYKIVGDLKKGRDIIIVLQANTELPTSWYMESNGLGVIEDYTILQVGQTFQYRMTWESGLSYLRNLITIGGIPDDRHLTNFEYINGFHYLKPYKNSRLYLANDLPQFSYLIDIYDLKDNFNWDTTYHLSDFFNGELTLDDIEYVEIYANTSGYSDPHDYEDRIYDSKYVGASNGKDPLIRFSITGDRFSCQKNDAHEDLFGFDGSFSVRIKLKNIYNNELIIKDPIDMRGNDSASNFESTQRGIMFSTNSHIRAWYNNEPLDLAGNPVPESRYKSFFLMTRDQISTKFYRITKIKNATRKYFRNQDGELFYKEKLLTTIYPNTTKESILFLENTTDGVIGAVIDNGANESAQPIKEIYDIKEEN